MPNRILSEDILLCEPVAMLSPQAEVFYRRLMSAVDDFGRADARHSILRARLYTFTVDEVGDLDIEDWLAECEAAGLIQRYRHDGTPYLFFRGLDSPRAKSSEFPAPPGRQDECCNWDEIRAKSVVYFILDHIAQAVKIGVAINPVSRLRELQTANPNPLTLIGIKEGGQKKEREYHRQFEAQRIRPDGEWFYIVGALAEFLSSEGFR